MDATSSRLLERIRAELSASFVAGRPIRVASAPGTLDVFGGGSQLAGVTVCAAAIERHAAVALQERTDRLLQVFSFNRLDLHIPFTLTISLDALADAPLERLRANFNEPGRPWAGYLIGCLAILHDEKLIDLRATSLRGLNVALLNDVPDNVGLGSNIAAATAMMLACVDHANLRGSFDGSLDVDRVAQLVHRVQADVVGVAGGVAQPMTSLAHVPGTLTRIRCQPGEREAPVKMPIGVGVVALHGVPRHTTDAFDRGRVAARMGHKLLLEEMRRYGAEAGRELIADPMQGYLANLDSYDYRKFFRGRLSEWMRGSAFNAKHSIDPPPETDVDYPVQLVLDHHVLEGKRAREFARFIEEAGSRLVTADARKLCLDKSGHLMYASFKSYRDGTLGESAACDRLVELVRKNEPRGGFFGARMTGRGEGGVVAVLCEAGERSTSVLNEILAAFERETGQPMTLIEANAGGAWGIGTQVIVFSSSDNG